MESILNLNVFDSLVNFFCGASLKVNVVPLGEVNPVKAAFSEVIDSFGVSTERMTPPSLL